MRVTSLCFLFLGGLWCARHGAARGDDCPPFLQWFKFPFGMCLPVLRIFQGTLVIRKGSQREPSLSTRPLEVELTRLAVELGLQEHFPERYTAPEGATYPCAWDFKGFAWQVCDSNTGARFCLDVYGVLAIEFCWVWDMLRRLRIRLGLHSLSDVDIHAPCVFCVTVWGYTF